MDLEPVSDGVVALRAWDIDDAEWYAQTAAVTS
jgi:hypothetical protein